MATLSPEYSHRRNPAHDDYRYDLDAEVDADTASAEAEPPMRVCAHLHTTTATVTGLDAGLDAGLDEPRVLCLDCNLDLGPADNADPTVRKQIAA